MDSNYENIITSELKINTIYELKFPKSDLIYRYKLITKHDTTKNYEILYTFVDDYGNRVQFTNSIFKNMTVNEYNESQSITIRINVPSVLKETVTTVPPIISINSYINNKSNLFDNDDLYT